MLVVGAGHIEVSNFWLLRGGDPEAFDTWYELHRDAWGGTTGSTATALKSISHSVTASNNTMYL